MVDGATEGREQKRVHDYVYAMRPSSETGRRHSPHLVSAQVTAQHVPRGGTWAMGAREEWIAVFSVRVQAWK